MSERSAELKIPESKYNLKIRLQDSQVALLLCRSPPMLISVYFTYEQQRSLGKSAMCEYSLLVFKQHHDSRVHSQDTGVLMGIVMIPPG